MSSVSQAQRDKVAAAFAAAATARTKEQQSLPLQQQAQPAKQSKAKAVPAKQQKQQRSQSQSPEKQRWAGGAHANTPDPTAIPLPSLLVGSAPSDSGANLLSLLGVPPPSESSLAQPLAAVAPPSAPLLTPGQLLTPDQLLAVQPAPTASSSAAADILSMLRAPATATATPIAAPPPQMLPSSCHQEVMVAPNANAAASQALREMLNF